MRDNDMNGLERNGTRRRRSGFTVRFKATPSTTRHTAPCTPLAALTSIPSSHFSSLCESLAQVSQDGGFAPVKLLAEEEDLGVCGVGVWGEEGGSVMEEHASTTIRAPPPSEHTPPSEHCHYQSTTTTHRHALCEGHSPRALIHRSRISLHRRSSGDGCGCGPALLLVCRGGSALGSLSGDGLRGEE